MRTCDKGVCPVEGEDKCCKDCDEVTICDHTCGDEYRECEHIKK